MSALTTTLTTMAVHTVATTRGPAPSTLHHIGRVHVSSGAMATGRLYSQRFDTSYLGLKLRNAYFSVT